MMGFDPMTIPYIPQAHEAGLRRGRMAEIEVGGEDVSGVGFGFSVGDNMACRVGDLLWFGPFRRLQRLFFHTPLVYLFIFCSFFYRDYLWLPFKGRRIQRSILQDTQWGRLFAHYQPGANVRGPS